MPRPKIQDEALIDALIDVFCEHGFEGASLSIIARATGLQRASLYHRFPGGKEEMAVAVLESVLDHFGGHVLAPMGEEGDPKVRTRRAGERISGFYMGGKRSCLLETMSLGQPTEAVRGLVQDSFGALTDAFAGVAREAGATKAVARRRAEDAVLRIQGALVLARGSGDSRAFERTIKALPAWLVEGEGAA